MKSVWWVVIGWALAGCADVDEGPKQRTEQPMDCSVHDDPIIELAQDGPYGLSDGDEIAYGNPPQGGPPFAPFSLRLDGIYGAQHGVEIFVEARDLETGAILGDADLVHRFLCANTGTHEGWFVAGEVHLRFWDETLEDLEGRMAAITATVTGADGTEAFAGYEGALVWAYL